MLKSGRRDEMTASKLQSRCGIAALLGSAMVLGLGGCSTWDSYLDPSKVGRWERTPTRVPILTHLAAIEDPEQQWVEKSEITPEDLQPQNDVYRVGAGDVIALTIWDLVQRGAAEVLPRQVDQNGYVEVPQLGRIFVSGLTEPEVAEAVASRMEGIVADPLVSVVVESRRQQVFHLMGNVQNAGPYLVPSADYRLLEALNTAGGFPEFTDEILIIRQVSLTDDSVRPEAFGDSFEPNDPGESMPAGENLLDVIDDLSSPGALGGSMGGVVPVIMQPADGMPPIDLIDSGDIRQITEPSDGGSMDSGGRMLEPKWRYRNGQWTRESFAAAARNPIDGEMSNMPRDSRGDLFTQRVIRVPVKPLVAGDARYNVVIRPGDIVRVPPAEIGNFYLDGEVNRPGVYSLPQVGKMTLMRAITAGGGLGPTAIPERVDLTRMVGPDEQATIMLNLRAISEGTQPDVYLRRDDVINIGTNFWATPLAVVRGGFRTSYGFGFLLDRNFGNDVFGAPPTNQFGQ